MAFTNRYNMNVDIKRRITSVVPTFKQGDTGEIIFTVYDEGVLFDLTGYTYSELTFRLPSGTVLIGNPELVDGKLKYVFSGVELSEIGKTEVVLSIMSYNTMVSVQPFVIFTFDSMKDEDLSYVGILQQLILEVQNLGLEIDGLLAQVTETLQLAEAEVLRLQTLIAQVETQEQTRQDNETQRNIDEQLRKTNEQTRQSQEQNRQSEELTRQSQESARQSQESTRESSESTRQANEVIRQQKLTELEEIINNLEFLGDYSNSITYKEYNVVLYNGNSYVALQEVTSVTPDNDGVNWQLLARKGVDGQGAVSSVNGVLPNENGDVVLEQVEVVDTLSSSAVDKPLSANQGRILKGFVDDKAETVTYLATIGTSWSTSTPFTQSLTVVGLTEEDNPLVSPLLSDDMITALNQSEAYSYIDRAFTTQDTITFICYNESPIEEIPIQIKVVR